MAKDHCGNHNLNKVFDTVESSNDDQLTPTNVLSSHVTDGTPRIVVTIMMTLEQLNMMINRTVENAIARKDENSPITHSPQAHVPGGDAQRMADMPQSHLIANQKDRSEGGDARREMRQLSNHLKEVQSSVFNGEKLVFMPRRTSMLWLML